MLINYVREQVESGIVLIKKINGKLNRADIHTKQLRNGDFEMHAASVLGSTSNTLQPSVGI
jgi:hypothetical protein